MDQRVVLLSCALVYVLILILHTRLQGRIERKLFSIRIHHPFGMLVMIFFHSILGAIIASLLITVLGLQLSLYTMVGIAVVSILLAMIHIRYISFFYAAGIVSLLALITQQGWVAWDAIGIPWLQQYFMQISINSLLAFAGILYVIEAFLLMFKGNYGQIPAFYFGQRGKLVGGFLLQRLWLLPIFVLVPASIGWDLSFLPSWWPLFDHAATVQDGPLFTIIFLPILLGFTSIVIGRQPRELLTASGRWLLLAGIIIVALSYFSQLYAWLLGITALLVLLAHEILILVLQAKEKKSNTYFSHSKNGLMILAVLQGSPAAELGVVPGERIARVNGQEVKHTKELYAALQQNAAYCKLEVVNLAGNVKFLERSLYSGEHYLLGIVLAPDENSRTYIQSGYTNLFSLILGQLKMGKKQELE